MATLTLVIKTASATARDYQQGHVGVLKARNLLEGIVSGSQVGSVDTQVSATNPVAAAGTVTITYASLAANDTLTVGGQVLTCTTSAPTTGQFQKVTDGPTTATNLAAAINTHATLGKYFTATAVASVVTITANLKGSLLNLIAMAATGTGMAVVQLVGGTGGPEGATTTYAR
jgi:molybdopterin-binding protein